MSFCPRCGDEYRAGFTQCAECGVTLVDTPAPEHDHPRSIEHPRPFQASDYETIDPVRVATVPSRINAEIILSALRSADLRAFIAGTGMEAWSDAGGIGQITRVAGPLNDIRIMVHPDDEAEAREIIASAIEVDVPEFDEDDQLGESEPGSDGMRPVGDRPTWRTDGPRNRSVIRAFALFMIVPILAGGLSIFVNWLYVVFGD
jgi:hypothetical protein